MPSVRIEKDEAYPVYFLIPIADTTGKAVTLTNAELAQVQESFANYQAAQDLLRRVFGE